MRPKHVVSMNGGGIESAALLKILTEQGYEVTSVHVNAQNYPGAVSQLEAATWLAEKFDVPHKTIQINFNVETTTLWTDNLTIAPSIAWGTVMLSMSQAMGYALEAQEVWSGSTIVTDELQRNFESLIGLAPSIPWRPEFVFPFRGMTKKQVLDQVSLPQDVIDQTISCFYEIPCERCIKCRDRIQALGG